MASSNVASSNVTSSNAKNGILVDVIIPVHSETRPIERAVASILNHTKAKIRVSVVAHNIDREIITAKLNAFAADPRLRILHLLDNIPSPTGPMNLGFEQASAKYVALLGSDDTFAPGAIDDWLAAARFVGAAGAAGGRAGVEADIASGGAGVSDAGMVDGGMADVVIAPKVQQINGGLGNDSAGPTVIVDASPPVRARNLLGKDPRVLDPIKDRVFYRGALLGLISTKKFGHLRLQPGLQTGEDQPFAAEMWFAEGVKIVFPPYAGPYVEHFDQTDRVTHASRSVAEEFRYLDVLLDAEQSWIRNRKQRKVTILKQVRAHFFDSVKNRLETRLAERGSGVSGRGPGVGGRGSGVGGRGPGVGGRGSGVGGRGPEDVSGSAVGGFDPETGRDPEAEIADLAAVAKRLKTVAPEALGLLSRADYRLFEAVLGREPIDEIVSLNRKRQNYRSTAALITQNWWQTFHVQAPLRFHLAALLQAKRRVRLLDFKRLGC